jgi:hypothetical protein
VTHSYLTSKKGQLSGADHYGVKGNSGKSIWEKFVSQHKNIFLVLSGHALENLLTSQGKHGNTVHQVQADYWPSALTPYFRTTGLGGNCAPKMVRKGAYKWEENEEYSQTSSRPRGRWRRPRG